MGLLPRMREGRAMADTEDLGLLAPRTDTPESKVGTVALLYVNPRTSSQHHSCLRPDTPSLASVAQWVERCPVH